MDCFVFEKNFLTLLSGGLSVHVTLTAMPTVAWLQVREVNSDRKRHPGPPDWGLVTLGWLHNFR